MSKKTIFIAGVSLLAVFLVISGFLVSSNILMKADTEPNNTPTYLTRTQTKIDIKDNYLFGYDTDIKTFRYDLTNQTLAKSNYKLIGYENGKSLTEYTRNDDILSYDWATDSTSIFLTKAALITKINTLPLDPSVISLINSQAQTDLGNTSTDYNSGLINIYVTLYDSQGVVIHFLFDGSGYSEKALSLYYSPSDQSLSLIKYYNSYYFPFYFVRYGNNILYESDKRLWQWSTQTKQNIAISANYPSITCARQITTLSRLSYGPMVYKNRVYFIDVPGCNSIDNNVNGVNNFMNSKKDDFRIMVWDGTNAPSVYTQSTGLYSLPVTITDTSVIFARYVGDASQLVYKHVASGREQILTETPQDYKSPYLYNNKIYYVNYSSAYSMPLVIDTDYTFMINSGSQYIKDPLVSIKIDLFGIANPQSVEFSNDGNTWSPKQAISTNAYSWNVTNSLYGGDNNDGYKILHIRVTDGNSTKYDKTTQLILDRVGPIVTPVCEGNGYMDYLGGGSCKKISDTSYIYLNTNVDDTTFVSKYRVSLDKGKNWTSWDITPSYTRRLIVWLNMAQIPKSIWPVPGPIDLYIEAADQLDNSSFTTYRAEYDPIFVPKPDEPPVITTTPEPVTPTIIPAPSPIVIPESPPAPIEPPVVQTTVKNYKKYAGQLISLNGSVTSVGKSYFYLKDRTGTIKITKKPSWIKKKQKVKVKLSVVKNVKVYKVGRRKITKVTYSIIPREVSK